MPRRRIGRFELLECLASGAFGDTYHAVDTVLDEEVALKVFKQPAWGIDALRAEVRPLVSIQHPNIIQYKDCNLIRDEDGKQILCDAAAGAGEFYDITEDGDLSLTRAHTNWSRSWSAIVSIESAGHDGTVLLFYDQSARRGEFYRVETDADIALLRSYEGWRSSWTRIVPICSGTREPPILLFYDDAAGQGEFYRLDAGCQLTMLTSREGWSTSWSHILALHV